MKKKIVSLLLVATVVAGALTGCSLPFGGDHKDQIEESAYGVMKGLTDADKDQINKYYSENGKGKDQISQIDVDEIEKKFYKGFGVSGLNADEYFDDNTKKSVREFSKRLATNFITDFKIESVEEDKDNNVGIVKAKVTMGYDTEKMSGLYSEVIQDATKDAREYQQEHLEELQQIYLEKGQKALYQKIFSEFVPGYLEKIGDKVDETGKVEKTFTITVEPTSDDKETWKVTNIKAY
ncbi:hypothetical protein SAMN04487761_11929 [Lachnospiraceae bacterium C7]|nr:hypothetical protein SAMN04487761_11929 [Lachnospiraceae bacterium C7]